MEYHFDCPWCGGSIVVDATEINCTIFRHAGRKDGIRVNPHARVEEMALLRSLDQILGCGMPFRFDGLNIDKLDFDDKFIE